MFLTKIIISIGLRQEQKFLRLLAKIEFGVSIFCKKLAVAAVQENKLNLAALLQSHSKEEEKHGKMLASLADGNERFHHEGSGRFISIVRPTGEELRRNVDYEAEGKVLEWDSVNLPGERLKGVFENFDGLSKRYCTLRLLFGNKSAFAYNWDDRLAFMYVLERQTLQFYEVLANSQRAPEPLRVIASLIARDEVEHADYLKSLLFHYNADIEKWRDRLWLASLGLIVDMWRFK
ncbi:MAG: ferritin-like domain-containing protein [Nostoc sp. NMS2]|uniref:ferritin-like domain-containing protein n=1 Tax=Nostoc sp. NMS2 TaxID=2815389 RepID=UPI0025CFEA8D|nr:ferritin-like domain-containing protein [Nostoc sp. NMS2]MBN3993837.1 ferritin-like domain-containing protein [Nostoc sp. NMS2]